MNTELWWVAEDEQASIPGGSYPPDGRKAAELVFRAELLTQCATDEERAGIEAGRFEWLEPSGRSLFD